MDSELSSKISDIVSELTQAEQARLQAAQAAGTFVELEELACEIGIEISRRLMSIELADRGNSTASETALCPDCGECCHQAEAAHHRRLASSRGKVSYYEPTLYCRDCRRSSFFPLPGRMGPDAGNGNSQANAVDGLGGSNLSSFSMA